MTHKLDLGSADVHQPAPLGPKQGKRPMAKKPTKRKRGKKVAVAPDAPPGRRLRIRADIGEGGNLHVRHMSARLHLASLLADASLPFHDRLVALPDARRQVAILRASDADLRMLRTPCGLLTAADAGEEGKRVWIQLAKPGAFRGHAMGPFELTSRTFAEIVRNFKATENQRVPIDFEHASEADPTEGNIAQAGAPAQGWIVDMRIQGGELWGLVEWGKLAREYIKTGQYRFFSPAIRFNSKDRVTGAVIGARMTSGALTNNPFLDGMQPLAAKDAVKKYEDERGITELLEPYETDIQLSGSMCYSANEFMPRLRQVLGVHALTTAAECSDHLDRLRDHLDAAGGDHEAMHEGVRLADFLKPMRDLVGGTPGMSWDDVFDRVQDMIDQAIAEHEERFHEGAPADGASMDDDEEEGADMSDRLDTSLAEANAALALCGR